MKDETQITFIPPWFIRRFPKLSETWFKFPLWIHQAVKFAVVGGMNTLVDWGLYWLLTRSIPYFAALPVLTKGISYTAGVINSFFWNKSFTFRVEKASSGKFILFLVINLLAISINSAVMAFGIHHLQRGELLSLVLATATTLLWNFLTSKYLIFKS